MMKMKKNRHIFLLATLLLIPMNTLAATKRETVYTNLNYDGSPIETQVSNHLSCVGNADLEDESILKDIMNINGDEEFSQNEDKLTWKTRGDDIFYKGKTSKSLPIKTEITYYLDGKEENLENMIGASGHIEIKYSFSNENLHRLHIDGYTETIYTPFLTTVGAIIKDGSKNVTVTNGKIVSTGSRTIVMGFASPGLYASTKISKFKNFDAITISYDTDNFTLGTTYIVSTPNFLADVDTNIFDKLNSLSTDVNSLQTNMAKLENGAKELVEGASSVANGSNSLTKNLYQVHNSMVNLKNGASTLDAGVSQILESLTAAQAELKSPESLQKIAQLNQLHNQNTALITKLKTAFQGAGLTEENLNNACLTQDALFQSNDEVQLFCLLNANNRAIEGSISSSKDMSEKIDALTSGVNALKSGSTELSSGLSSMNTGVSKIYEGSKTLSVGTETLKNGATTLSQGTTQFKEEGIEKLVSYANSLKNYSRRAEALVKTSKNYGGFASSNSDETVFISMISSRK